MTLPNDPVILYSLLNTKLRDQYSSLSDLCDDQGLDERELLNTTRAAGYVYDDIVRQFRKN